MSKVGLMWCSLFPLLAASGAARADDAKWCVDPTGTVSDWSFCVAELPCGGVVPTITDALASARAAGVSGGLAVCVGTPGVHSESVVLDNVDGGLGDTLYLRWAEGEGTNYCDSAQPGSAALQVLGDGSWAVTVSNLRTQGSVCGDQARPLLRAGGADVTLQGAFIEELGGPVLVGEGELPSALLVHGAHLGRGSGAAIQFDGDVSLVGSELSGWTSSGEPVVSASLLAIGNSALFGNVVTDAPLVFVTGGLVIVESLVAENAVVGGEPLILVLLSGPVAPGSHRIHESEIGGNALLAAGGIATAVTSGGPPVRSAQPAQFSCLPGGSDGFSFASRPSLSFTGAASDSAVIELRAASFATQTVRIIRSMFAPNLTGGSGSLVRTSGLASNSRVLFFHNVVASQDGEVLDLDGPGLRFFSARNLLFGSPRLQLGPGVSGAEVTMDQLEVASPDWQVLRPGLVGVAGPFPRVFDWSSAEALRPGAEVLALGDCARIQLSCPEVTDCGAILAGPMVCPNLGGASLIPTTAAVLGAAVAWPWSTNPFPSATGFEQSGDMVGPTGWQCGGADFLPTDGDNDGFSSLIDCDDGDPLVTPTLPEFDGFNSEKCSPAPCYTCPPWSRPPDGDDDDSASSGDDDSAPARGDEAADPDQAVAAGCCGGRGCGTPIPTALLGLLLVAGGPRLRSLRRR